jgi:hypothetical protein
MDLAARIALPSLLVHVLSGFQDGAIFPGMPLRRADVADTAEAARNRGMSFRAIAADMNKAGMVSQAGTQYSAAAVSKMVAK